MCYIYLYIDVGNHPKKSRYCPEGRFTCADFTCISILGRCDRKVDCPNDKSDEEGCRMFWFSFISNFRFTFHKFDALKYTTQEIVQV